jgi:release factor glutamine methyltransferase
VTSGADDRVVAPSTGSDARTDPALPAGPTGPRGPRSKAPVESWTVLDLILWSADYLADKGVESPRLDAEHLLAHVVGVARLGLYLQFDRPLTSEELDGFRPLLRRRAQREPLQYIVGRQPFRELDLEVTPAVLIPRPETEVLVDVILEWAAERDGEPMTAVDIGTGSGAIALSLAFEGAFASVLATDVDEEALRVAGRNRDAAGLTGRVELRHGPLFEPLRPGERFDVIVSNPPYVAESEAATLQPEVADWEPRGALFGGEDGLDVLRGLVLGARDALKPGGMLALEVGAGQAATVARMMEDADGYDDVRVRRDYAGKQRIVSGRRA